MKKLFITGLLAITTAAWADTSVKVDDAWVRGTVASQKASGAFMRLTPSAKARLVAAESPVAGVVEIHEMAMENNVMKMRQVPGLDLPAGQTTELKPGGYHVMLLGLASPLEVGDTFDLTLLFESGASETVTVEVREG